MLSGKAIARAVHAHFIFDAALNAMMHGDVLNAPLPIQPDKSNSNDNAEVATMLPDMYNEVIDTPELDEAQIVYEKMVDGTMSVEDICWSDVLHIIKDRLHKHTESANMSSSTLGSVHGHDIYILRKYIRTEHAGNWHYICLGPRPVH